MELATADDVNHVDMWMMLLGNVVMALPLDQHVGTSKFVLRATDTKGLYKDLQVTVRVQEKQLTAISQVRLVYPALFRYYRHYVTIYT